MDNFATTMDNFVTLVENFIPTFYRNDFFLCISRLLRGLSSTLREALTVIDANDNTNFTICIDNLIIIISDLFDN
jgi:hypothetical protein